MGLYSSKVKSNVSLQEGSVPAASAVTPKNITKENLDPRSPSLNITRTPLELLHMSQLEGSTEVTVTPLKPYKVLEVDPRSPAVDFHRTPIVVNVNEEQPEKLKNKNLERVLSSSTPSPRLVGSRRLTKQLEATHKRRSLAGLLETNIDFTETDLDAVARERNKCESTSNKLEGGLEIGTDVNGHDGGCDVSKSCTFAAADPISEESIPFSPGATSDSILEDYIVPEQATDLTSDPIPEGYIPLSQEATDLASVSIPENYTPLPYEATNVVSDPITADAISDSSNGLSPDTSEVIISLTPDPAVSYSTHHPIVFDSMPDIVPTFPNPSSPVTPPNDKLSEIDLSADVREFDRKMTNLIYEDRDLIVCPKIVELKDVMERSPLKSLNLSEKKSAQKLRVSSKPRKSDYAISKIPVFKDKRKSGVQCENTPPVFLEDGRSVSRKTRWDNADATLYL